MLITIGLEAVSCGDPRIFCLPVWFGFVVVSYNVFSEIKYDWLMMIELHHRTRSSSLLCQARGNYYLTGGSKSRGPHF